MIKIQAQQSDNSSVIKQEDLELQKKIEAQLKEEIEHNSQPLWLTKQYVDKPLIIAGISAAIFILCTIISVAANMTKMAPSNNRDYLIWDDERTGHYDMFEEAKTQFLQGQQNSQIPINTLVKDEWTTFIILNAENEKENILDVENFKFLYETEQKMKSFKTYENFCLKSQQDNLSSCSEGAHFSITSLFSDPSNVTQQEINTVLNSIVNDETKWLTYKGMFGNEFSATNQNSHLIRSMFFFGGPIEIDGIKYKDIFDREDEQDEKFDDLSQEMLDYIEDEDLVTPGGVLVLGYSKVMQQLQSDAVSSTDFLYAIGSIIFVLIYMGIHLKSIFLSSMSMLSILFSFPITLVIFNGILRITYFSSLHILIIFIVLGIAADNVFVFIDCWNQTNTYQELQGDYHKRMAFTFRRASKAMLATSSTTAAAFFSTGLSPIMPISSFGFFAGILIPVNFVLVITFFPAILMIYEKYTKNMCSKKDEEDINSQQMQQQGPQSSARSRKRTKSKQNIQVSKLQQKIVKAKEHSLVKFFDNEFNDFVFKFRYVIICVTALWTIFAMVRALQLPALSKPEQFLPDDHPSTISSDVMRYDFHMSGNSDTGIKVNWFWGVDSINKDDVGTWDPTDLGELKWDNEFNLSSQGNQQYFYDLCVSMKSNDLVQDGLVTCFMTDFKEFIEDQGETFPVQENQFLEKLIDFTTTSYGISHFNENSIGIINNELKYVQIELSAHGIPFSPYLELNPIYEKWDKLVKDTNKSAPKGLNNSYQTAQMGWVFMITEKAFTDSAMEGTAISIVFAFVVLMLTTHNIIISCYSILTIVGIVMSVISIMEMSGWELGVAESIAIVILIGMSVDYVVHLANHYVESVYPDRFRKMKVSLKDLGISIISGATTTIGSGIFLFFATMIIFNKFAILIVATICFSLAYALVFFSALVHVAGPQGEQGNYLVLVKRCFNKNKYAPKNIDNKNVKQVHNSDTASQNQNEILSNDLQIINNNQKIPNNNQYQNDYRV